jgi:hypothetical protein
VLRALGSCMPRTLQPPAPARARAGQPHYLGRARRVRSARDPARRRAIGSAMAQLAAACGIWPCDAATWWPRSTATWLKLIGKRQPANGPGQLPATFWAHAQGHAANQRQCEQSNATSVRPDRVFCVFMLSPRCVHLTPATQCKSAITVTH